MTNLLWFRRDLRLDDHPALLAAAGGVEHEVLGVFVADENLLAPSGAPRRAFLAGCLKQLSAAMGGRLLVTTGPPEQVLPALARRVGAAAVHVSADFGPYGRRRDETVAAALEQAGIDWQETGSAYAISPGRVRKPDGSPYAVFTPFFRAWSEHGYRRPAGPAGQVRWIDPRELATDFPDALAQIDATLPDGLTLPDPGERAASRSFETFLTAPVSAYDTERDRPDHQGTSRMSFYLKWGCVHPRTLLAALAANRSAGAAAYRRELAFREFYADVLLHRPDSPRVSVDPVIDEMGWDSGPTADERLAAWQAGRTGYPYIDAGMRQLLADGWIHNRVRMGVASFLIKDLHLSWQQGAHHFMHHLVDGDLASNTHGWQWVAGSGAQAAPYYRIFNPIGQGEKFDPDGDYVRRYVAELAGVAGKAVHRPWDLPDGPPAGYPGPIVDHATERTESLRRWEHRPRPADS